MASTNRPSFGAGERGGVVTIISGEPVCVYVLARAGEIPPHYFAPAELSALWNPGIPESEFVGLAEPDCPLSFGAEGTAHLAMIPPVRTARASDDLAGMESLCRPSTPAANQFADARVETHDVTVVTWRTEAAAAPKFAVSTWLRGVRPDEIAIRSWAEMPSGEFWIGCNALSGGCDSHDQGYQVRVTRAFSIASDEVSNGEYLLGQLAISTALPFLRPAIHAESSANRTPTVPVWQSLGYPAVNVSHDEAAQFCRMMGGRLPTEVEWEYAARRDGGPRLRSGAPPLKRGVSGEQRAGASSLAVPGEIRPLAEPARRTAPVNMRANAAEWTEDRYEDSVYSERREVPRPPTTGNRFVVSGGDGAPGGLWPRAFHDGSPDPKIGFRCVKE